MQRIATRATLVLHNRCMSPGRADVSKRTWVGAVGMLCLVALAGCGGGGHSVGASSSAFSNATASPQASRTLPKSYPPLLAAVTHYFALIRGGEARQAYRRAVSDRCRQEETFAEFQRVVGTGQLNPGTQFYAYRTHGSGRGAVQFVFPHTPFNPTAWHWIKERGVWKEDGCAPSG
jgi:hypothetical protein